MIAIVLSLLGLSFFAFGFYATNHITGSVKTEQRFDVQAGENAYALGIRLEQSGIVFSRFTFLWYLFHEQKTHQIVAGQYLLSGSLTVPEIAILITTGKTVSRDIKVTFPEGWTMAKMAERLTARALPGDAFLALAQKPLPEWRKKFFFLQDIPNDASLEGYLFPDTYQFAPEATAQDIISTMLEDFDSKFDASLRQSVAQSGRNLFDLVTLASIIEEEGRTADERNMISGIFWNRIALGQPLQSDATVNYIHGTTRLQPTFKDTEIDSPYNTYKYKGLPLGPISNPGLMSLRAAISPKKNPYYYFLVDPATNETIYSQTFDEHVRNRALHGL